jgi:hypothetical protein
VGEEGLFGETGVVVRQGTVDQPHLISPDLVDAQEELLGSTGVQIALANVSEGVHQIFLRRGGGTREIADSADYSY